MRRPSLPTVEIKSVDESAVRRAVDEYAAALFFAHAHVLQVIVFGSFATRTFSPGSDVDIFILLSGSDKSVRDRIPDFLPKNFPVGVDIFPYTQSEVAVMEDSPVMQAVKDSPWRYERPDAGYGEQNPCL
jgi:predicted nucleotidyltransferase